LRKYKKNTILLVDWVDITDHNDWYPEEKAEKKELSKCQSVGYYLNHDNESLRISSTISGNDRSVIVIPMGCVKKVKKLKE